MKDCGNLLSLHFASCFAAQLATISFLAPRCPAQDKKYPPVESLDAHAIFCGYCAPCHGLNGKGYGPAASSLNSKVADLTLLTKRSKGEFLRDRVRNLLEGTQTPAAHGSHEMPVWGQVFHQVEADQDLGSVRVHNLVAYIESLQRKCRHLGHLSAPCARPGPSKYFADGKSRAVVIAYFVQDGDGGRGMMPPSSSSLDGSSRV